MVNNAKDTKQKILSVAMDLFGRQGFDGVSIRNIAEAADVNVAAVNYHFTNKKNLFQEVFIASHSWLTEKIDSMVKDKDLSIKDLAWTIQKLFLDNASMVLNTYRIFLSEQLDISQEFYEENCRELPPGGEVILATITKELGENIPQEERIRLVRVIFAHISHMSIVVSTKSMNHNRPTEDWMTEEHLQITLFNLIEGMSMLFKSKY